MLSRLPRNAPAWLDRLSEWLEPFEICFTHVAQRGAFRRYLLGLLSDSRHKSMSAMLERVTDPGTYQSFQHFITHAPWSAERVWRHMRTVIPERSGVLILDGTSFPKQGPHSVGVARQYCGSLGKIANCQVAVTAALWTGARAWMLGAALYLPEAWLTPDARQRAQIPGTVRFQEKWRLALTLLQQIRARGFQLTAVVGDAEFGDSATLRRTLHRTHLPYALGVSADLKVLLVTPVLQPPVSHTGTGRPRSAWRLPHDTQPLEARTWAASRPSRDWRLVSWRNGTNPSLASPLLCPPRHPVARLERATPRRFRRLAALRTRPRVDAADQVLSGQPARHGVAPRAAAPRPSTVGDRAAVSRAERRTRARSLRGSVAAGWQRHVVLTALAYSWLQYERRRRGARLPTLPVARAVFTEILTAHFFVTRPHYLRTMQKLAEINLRI